MEGNSAATAFRILGKFGGANRRMLNEPQARSLISFAKRLLNLQMKIFFINHVIGVII